MPILTLIDVSLSMLAPLENAQMTAGDGPNRRTAAIDGVTSFLDYLQSNNRQEFVSLASFSEDVDFIDFTKDYASLQENLTKAGAYEVRTKSNIVEALRGVLYRCVAVWGSNVLCHVVVVTDCSGCSPEFERLVNSLALLEGQEIVKNSSERKSSQNESQSTSRIPEQPSPFAAEFHQLIRRGAFTFHVVGVNSAVTNDGLVLKNVRLYKKLIDFFDNGGTYRFVDESGATPTATFRKLAEELSENSASILRCGSFVVPVDVVPALKPIKKETDFDLISAKLGDAITIVGFLRPAELGSPPITSRHLLLESKRSLNGENLDPTKQQKAAVDDDNSPHFCVLLHGTMKVEDMVAVCEIGQNWYGYIYHLPGTKRSNLVLHCFEPGIDAVPWLGPLNKLTLRPFIGAAGAATPTAAKSPFPIPFKSKPSYAMSNPNWIHSYGLQADVQKVLRYARKLPEKELQFHQELSRVCNEALTLGYTELFSILARLLEKELTTAAAGPQAPLLKNAISILLSGRVKFGDPLSQFGK